MAYKPALWALNCMKGVLREFLPPHIRFLRSGSRFLAHGEPEVHELPRLVEPGTVAVDVGANIGCYAFALCRAVGPEVAVHTPKANVQCTTLDGKPLKSVRNRHQTNTILNTSHEPKSTTVLELKYRSYDMFTIIQEFTEKYCGFRGSLFSIHPLSGYERLRPEGHVLCVEPLEDLARFLQAAADRLGLPMSVVNCALSFQPGTADLHVPWVIGQRWHTFASLEHAGDGGETHRVELRRLDDVVAGVGRRISFIKIDAEGHELAILRGSVATLRQHHPTFLWRSSSGIPRCRCRRPSITSDRRAMTATSSMRADPAGPWGSST